MRAFRVILFAGLVALAVAGPVSSEESSICTCDILAASKWFTVAWQDTCPGGSANQIGKEIGQLQKKQLLERLAHGVAFASQAWYLVQNNPDLQAKLEASPAVLVHGRSGPVRREEVLPEPDSVLARFRRADKASTAKLYTVRLGDYGSEQAAETGATHWKFLRRDSENPSPALEESLLSVTWKYSSCAGERSPALFILPPSLSSSGRYELDFRLVIDQGDARRLAALIQERSLAHVQVTAVAVDWAVLATVLSQ